MTTRSITISLGAALLILCGLFACSKPANYLYVHPPGGQFYSLSQKVKDVSQGGSIDIFWTIGAMTEQASNFQSGVTTFMNAFIQNGFDWKMAVVADNTTERPYLGMPHTFDYTDASPTQDFVSGVMNALNGDDEEMMFDPTVVNLQNYPGFVRSSADLLAVILTNDAPDSSEITTTAAQMMSFLASLKGGDLSKVIVYGVFGADDMGCLPGTVDGGLIYQGSELQKLIVGTGGQAYSLCTGSFGSSLTNISNDLVKHMTFPVIPLSVLPDPTTIQVLYHNQALPGGPQASGGVWYYNASTNSIVFYNLNFAVNPTDSVTVTFTTLSTTN